MDTMESMVVEPTYMVAWPALVGGQVGGGQGGASGIQVSRYPVSGIAPNHHSILDPFSLPTHWFTHSFFSTRQLESSLLLPDL